MKTKPVLKSPTALSPEVFEPESDRPVQLSPKPGPVRVQKLREAQVPVPVPEDSIFAGYPHWGLNE